MSNPLILTTTLPKPSTSANVTSNFYKDIIRYLDLPEWLIIAIVAVSVLIMFLLFILICSKCCFKKCFGESYDKDKYKKRKLGTKEIDKILQEEFGHAFHENFGKIHFSLKYNLVKQLLAVKIIRAENLPQSNDGSADPYVITQIKSKSNNEEKRTKTKMKTENPVFNEKFSFKLLQAEMLESTIIFKVYDYDKFGADSLLGQLTLCLKDINMASIINTLSEFSKDLEIGDDTSTGMGQICVILNNAGQSGLYVTILEAKNLRYKEGVHYSHIFVTVKLKSPHKSKKFKTIVKKRTKDCPCSPFPYFNETYLFNKPQGTISDCQISIKMWISGYLKMATCLGHVLLGSEVSLKSGEMHWKNMLDNPRHPVAKWHILMSPNVKEN